MGSGCILATCLGISYQILAVYSERPAVFRETRRSDSRVEIEAFVNKHDNTKKAQLRGVDISARFESTLNSLLPVIPSSDPEVRSRYGTAKPLKMDSTSTGYPGSIEISQQNPPQIGCASTYQEADGYEIGIVIANITLDVDVQFDHFDLSSLLGERPYLQPVGKYLVFEGMLRVRIKIPVQRIGFEFKESGYWEATMFEDDTQKITVEARDFVNTEWRSSWLAALKKELPGWMLGTDGTPQNFLDWIMKTDKIGIWPCIANKVSTKVEEKSLANLGGTAREVLLAASNSWVARKFFSAASSFGIGGTDCIAMAHG